MDDRYKLVSRIKRVFSDEVIKLIAATCDSKTIGSDQDKQMIIRSILKTYGVKNYMLGGATNRIVFFIDAYAYKIALNTEGYRDNLMEYSVARDPYLYDLVTKSYETNGYILVAECVKALTKEDYAARKREIIRKLDTIATKYLFHDVGTDLKNYTNWGIRDGGDLVMLDYAYMHRAHEDLFTCDHCGVGILMYNATFSHLVCNNRSGGCTKTYSYNERKAIQGTQVDLDRMREAMDESMVLEAHETEKEVSLHASGRIVDGDTIVIETHEEYIEYLKEVNNKMSDNFNKQQSLSKILRMAREGKCMGNGIDSTLQSTTVLKSGNKVAVLFDVDELIDDDYEKEEILVDENGERDWTTYIRPMSQILKEARENIMTEQDFVDDSISQLDAIDAVVDKVESVADKNDDGVVTLNSESKKGGEA